MGGPVMHGGGYNVPYRMAPPPVGYVFILKKNSTSSQAALCQGLSSENEASFPYLCLLWEITCGKGIYALNCCISMKWVG
jgi:hypothetical protein